MAHKNVLIIGGGIAGLSAALELDRLGIGVELVEKQNTLGGHTRMFSCKATDKCVGCGACIVEEKIRKLSHDSGVTVHLASRVMSVEKGRNITAILSGPNDEQHVIEADAVILASGFSLFDPAKKPYGYGIFENVLTNLEMESLLRRNIFIQRPSDQKEPKKVGFVQCVGSRDAKLKHLWCSKYCCGSALRMANLIKFRQPEIEATVFYMDIQTFGKDFDSYFEKSKTGLRFIRAIPGDVIQTEDGRLLCAYFDTASGGLKEESFDLLVLSVGITPGEDLVVLSNLFDLNLLDSGFIHQADKPAKMNQKGIFAAGTVYGPMGISESMGSAGKTVMDVAEYLGI